ncbi:MAG: TIGR01620 family protein [Rhizobiaceae bacterium]|nr:TIGR01620 family protein [Rhizobiaceae bacterium]
MSEKRKPASFKVEPESPPTKQAAEKNRAPRKPLAVKPEKSGNVVPAAIDVIDEIDPAELDPPPVPARRKRSRLGAIFVAAFGVLVSAAIGLWIDSLIRDLFARADWLGWAAAGLAAIAGFALFAILTREFVAMRRLASVEAMRARATKAESSGGAKEARKLVSDLTSFLTANPGTAAGRKALAELKDDVIDGPDLLRLAETELLSPLDRQASTLIADAAKRVSIVTAVSPRALFDVGYVVFEAGRLVRRLSELYGARPGTLGFFRLGRSVIAHLAVTGSIAAGDSLVQQLVGHGLAARLSAKLGEGVINGMMTARIGIAAMETARPLPFKAVKRPGMGEFIITLTQFSARKGAESDVSAG